MNKTTWTILAVALVAVAGIGIYALAANSGEAVDVVRVERGEIRSFVDERAKTRLPKTYLITMPYAGRIAPITLDEGDTVKRDDPLAPVAQVVQEDIQLNVDEARAVVKRLEASITQNLSTALEELAKQQAQEFNNSMVETVKAAASRMISGQKKYEVAMSHLHRIERLVKPGASTEEDLENAQLEEVQARVDFRQDELVHNAMVSLAAATQLLPTMVQQYIKDKSLKDAVLQNEKAEADARLKKAELEKSRGTITSPVDGVVLERMVSNERFLAAGEPLLEIGRLEDLQVEADVLSLDVVDVKPGDPVEIYGPAIGQNVRGIDGRDFAQGTVDRIYPAGFTKISSLGVEQQRVKVIVRFAPDDLQWLRANRGLGVSYRVRVRITTADRPDVLVVPRSALFRGSDDNWQLFVVRDGRLAIQTVGVGILNDQHAEIVDGLKEGDLVVRSPESNLVSDQSVRPVLPPEPAKE